MGRTGTLSLKTALERLLGAPCYHMVEVFAHEEHRSIWQAAARGEMPDWEALLADYAATVDWPAAAFWPELREAFPDAIVLLSYRDSQAWWESASETSFPGIQNDAPPELRVLMDGLFSSRFTNAIDDREACIAAYERHNASVREAVPAARLVEWQPGDGWASLCTALNTAVPNEPFPHRNTREDWAHRRANT